MICAQKPPRAHSFAGGGSGGRHFQQLLWESEIEVFFQEPRFGCFLTLCSALASNKMCNGQLTRRHVPIYGKAACFTKPLRLLIFTHILITAQLNAALTDNMEDETLERYAEQLTQ